MNARQIRNQLVEARISRTVAGKAFGQASAALTKEEHAALDAGVRVESLTPGQQQFFAALRVYNQELDRVEKLKAELEMTRACEACEKGFVR